MRSVGRLPAAALASLLLLLLATPLVALLISSTPADLRAGLHHPLVLPALRLTLQTTVLSMMVTVFCGLPLAWLIARSSARWTRVAEAVTALPIVIPPAVVGIALLVAFGRTGWFGGLRLPFSTAAVVIAQVVVAAPFFVQSAVAGFRRIDDDQLLVAATLGASPTRSFLFVVLPSAAPALLSGLGMAWARAAGEFGATLLFAGNMPGRTQTMPLAIYSALESDVRAAQTLALILAATAFILLLSLRMLPRIWMGRGA